jgi:uncharacterized HAD superfamily protein/hypoxanthine phosphoribosyltransferase
MVSFRTVSDVFACARRNRAKIPPEIDLVVGVPRSGMIAATAISLTIQRPLMDLTTFLDGQEPKHFTARRQQKIEPGATSILIVDDSIYHGAAMRQVRKRISEVGPTNSRIYYCAVYGLVDYHPEVDVVLEVCPAPRIFEWNALNHSGLEYCCLDLDGVIGADPTEEENDDGPNYAAFMDNAVLLNAPAYAINAIVTARLEKYRGQTDKWLARHNIRYRDLYMLDLPSAEERRRLGIHASFKASVYSARPDCLLFIESNLQQAQRINRISGKAVLAYCDMVFLPERTKIAMRRRIGSVLPPRSKPLIKKILRLS